jgi:hypothetical protein
MQAGLTRTFVHLWPWPSTFFFNFIVEESLVLVLFITARGWSCCVELVVAAPISSSVVIMGRVELLEAGVQILSMKFS